MTKKWVGDLVPRIRKKLHENKEKSWQCIILWNRADGYEIGYEGNSFIIDFSKKSYTCRAWDLSGVPCCHATCAINDRDDQPEDWVSPWYKKDTFLKAYSCMMTPING